MAKIVDPDLLEQGTEITITPGVSGTITLNAGSGDLVAADGVTLQCIYSFLKEEWLTDSTLNKYSFPLVSITEESFELVNNWQWGDSNTKTYIRDAGWAWKDANGNSNEEWTNITTLGSFNNSADKAYYIQEVGGTPSDMVYSDAVNEPVKIFGDAGYGDFDYRDYFKIYLREEEKSYDSYNLLTEQSLTALTYKKYAMPLSNALDIKTQDDDAAVVADASGFYGDVDVSYYSAAQSRTIGSNSYNFHVIIDGDFQEAEYIYTKIQYLLRQTGDINSGGTAGAVRGDTADELLEFIGDTLRTKYVAGHGGTYIDNYNTDDINRLEFIDDTNPSTPVTFPYTATGSFSFNDNLVNDSNAQYWMYFTSIGASAFGTDDAILVEDASSNTISGYASAASIPWTFDYDGNEQGGRTKATNAPVTVVALGLDTAQYVKTTHTITRATGQTISLVAALERNYSNPA